MDRDPRVCVIGEDVGHYGGSYKVTQGLAKKFGDIRVLDTPIAENSFTGGQFTLPLVIRGPGGVGSNLEQSTLNDLSRISSQFLNPVGCVLNSIQCQGPDEGCHSEDNPVILFEHVLLYNLKEKIPDEEYVCSLEEAEMVRPGEHVTILTYSRMRYHVQEAVETLVSKGYDPEVIDIRMCQPRRTLEDVTIVQTAQIVTAVEELC
ncbi:hypothetical protein IFM89_039945, partial [Coptis chinensis]